MVVDNVFATPLLQGRCKFGADIVVYSGTKHIDGQGRVLGGVVLGDREWITEKLHNYLKHRPLALAVHRLGAAQGSGDAARSASSACRSCGGDRRIPRRRTGVTRVWYPTRADHPQQALALGR